MQEFMDEFMYEMSRTFPKLLVQFEVCLGLYIVSVITFFMYRFCIAPKDFVTENAFKYLDRYRNKYPVFNDDIQGTGAVVLAGFLNAAKLSSEASGLPMTAHRVLFYGAGSAIYGVSGDGDDLGHSESPFQ